MKRTKEFVRILDSLYFLGKRDRDIYYVRHKGDFVELSKMAYERNCTMTSISQKEYDEFEDKVRFAEEIMKGKLTDKLL